MKNEISMSAIFRMITQHKYKTRKEGIPNRFILNDCWSFAEITN